MRCPLPSRARSGRRTRTLTPARILQVCHKNLITINQGQTAQILGWPPAQWPLSDLIVGMKHLTPIQNPALPFPFHCQYTKREPNTSHDPQIKTDQMETLMKRLIGSTDILHWKSSCNPQIFPFTFTFDHIAITLKVSVQSCIIQNSTNNLN